jgi:uncharacterized protein (DUF4415 family)
MNKTDKDMAEEYDFSNAKRGAIVKPKPGTIKMTIRLEEALLNWLRTRLTAQGGGDYDDVINQAVREYKQRVEAE